MPCTVANSRSPTRSGSPGSSAPSACPCPISSKQHREGAVGGFREILRRLPVLAGEHQLEQLGILDRELDVGAGGRLQPCLEVLAGAGDGAPQFGTESLETRLGKGVEQRLAIGEVAARRTVADAHVAGELAQRQLADAALANGELGLGEQGGP